MTETPRQRRTAASILEGIQQRLKHENVCLLAAQSDVLMLKERVATLESVLLDAEKHGEDE